MPHAFPDDVAAAMRAGREPASGDEFCKTFSKANGRSARSNVVKRSAERASAPRVEASPKPTKRLTLPMCQAIIGSPRPSGAGKSKSVQERKAINARATIVRRSQALKFLSTIG